MRRALIALTILAALVAAPAASGKVRQGPKGAAFYDPPGNATGKHGTLIWARRQTGSDAIAGRRSRLLLYRYDPENVKIRTPVRVEQGDADGTVFKTFTDQLVDEYEAEDAKVTYKVYPGVDHGGIVKAGAADATTWIRGRFRK